jgi:hypothetical protein
MRNVFPVPPPSLVHQGREVYHSLFQPNLLIGWIQRFSFCFVLSALPQNGPKRKHQPIVGPLPSNTQTDKQTRIRFLYIDR